MLAFAPLLFASLAVGAALWLHDCIEQDRLARCRLEARVADLEAEVMRLATLVDEEKEAAEFWGDALEVIAWSEAPSWARSIAREAMSKQPIDWPERIAA